MNEQLLKTSGADVLSSRKKTQKNLPGGLVDATPPPPHSPTLYVVRPRVNTTITSFILYEKFLQFDWLRAVVFQLHLKYPHVKITKLLRVVV